MRRRRLKAVLKSPEAMLGLGSLAIAVAPGVAGILAARSLGPEGRGQLAVMLALGTLAGTLGMRGLDTALVANPHAGGKAARNRLARTRAAAVLVGEGLIAGVLTCLVLSWTLWYGGLLAVALAAATCYFMLIRANNVSAAHVGDALKGDLVLASVVLVGSGAAASMSVGPAWFLAAAVLGMLSGGVVGALRQNDGSRAKPAVVRETRLRLGTIGRPAWLSRGLQASAFRLDRVVLAAAGGAAAAGVYAAVVPFAEMATIVPLHLSQLVTARVARDSGTRSWHRLRETRVAVGVSGALTALVIVFAPIIVEAVYGPEFTGGVAALRILAVASLVSVLWRFVEAELFGRQRAWTNVLASAVAAVLVLLLTFLLSDLGARAPAIASLVGYSAALAVALVGLRRRAHA